MAKTIVVSWSEIDCARQCPERYHLTCSKCGQEKAATEFYLNTRAHWCKTCFTANASETRRRRQYVALGIDQEWYDTLAESGCGICGGPPSPRYGVYHIDHNHSTGLVRGLLCDTCNTGIGLLRDDIDTLQRAIDYLRGHGG